MTVEPRTLKFYSKPGCHLCDDAIEKVLRLAAIHGLSVEKVNIESSPGLFERQKHRIPVVELAGVELGWGRISEKGLERALRKAVGESRT